MPSASIRRPPGGVALALAALVFALNSSHAQAQRTQRATRRGAQDAASRAAPTALDSARFAGLQWRNIGPFRGGRVTAVTGVPGQALTFYMGATGGGVWRTDDGGSNWRNVSDGYFRMGSVGAIAVAPSDPNVVYVGMGEAPVRGVASSYGDGVYKSTDAGRSWTHIGLGATRQISRVAVHPRDADLVYVAAQGSRWAGTPERGVYRSTDGGKTWKLVLAGTTPTAGASDLSMDPTNPRVLYAAFWDHQRTPWTVRSGGKGSGIWKTTDGGDTWTRLTEGLPKLMGKIGVAVSPASPDRVYAIVEADSGGLFRTDDAGKAWQLVNGDRVLRARAWYYTAITADPQNANTVYVINAPLLRSIDAGRTFQPVPTPHGDQHQLWIDPSNSAVMINGNDGGANISFNGGRTWSTQDNQPTAQFYRANTEAGLFYRVYGGQQDNTSVAIASRTTGDAIDRTDWHDVGGCESARPAFDPKRPRYVYAGCYQGIISEYDSETARTRNVMVYPALGLAEPPREQKYRFNWSAPIVVSTHDPKVIYHGGNVLFRSIDRGRSWTAISPDLTRNEKAKQGPGGEPITSEGAGGEVYNTIYYVAESPHDAGVLWVGTDDGLVQLTRDGGKTWTNVTPPLGRGASEAEVEAIEVSPHDAATAYVAVSRYKFDDNAPYVFRTADYGRSWIRLTSGLPADAPVRVVREDPERRGLLYAGTETGVHLSFDGGAHWQRLPAKFPPVPVTDLQLRNGDLVASTEGRAFWILDDLSPLRQRLDSLPGGAVHLFAPRAAHRVPGSQGQRANAGTNAPGGAIIYYTLPRDLGPQPADSGALVVVADTLIRRRASADTAGRPAAGGTRAGAGAAGDTARPAATVEILDASGKVIRAYTTKKDRPVEAPGAEPPVPLPAKRGLNRLVWDLAHESAKRVPGVLLAQSAAGYRVPPGKYQVRLTLTEPRAGGPPAVRVLTQPLEVSRDPRLDVAPEALRAQAALLDTIYARVDEIHESVIAMRSVRDQVNRLLELVKDRPDADSVRKLGAALVERIGSEESRLVQPRHKTFQDVINFRNGLSDQYLFLAEAVGEGDAPTVGARERFAALERDWAEHKRAGVAVLERDLAAFNTLFKERGIPAVIVPTRPRAPTSAAPATP